MGTLIVRRSRDLQDKRIGPGVIRVSKVPLEKPTPPPKLDLPQEVREAVKWYAEHEGVDGQKVCESVFPALTYKAGQTLAAFIRRIAGEGA
jgi:hypothetical protein